MNGGDVLAVRLLTVWMRAASTRTGVHDAPVSEEAMSFTITTRRTVQSTSIRIAGEVDLECAHQLRAVLQGLEGDASLDCSELSFMDSTGMSVLLGAHRRFEAEGHHLRLVGVSHTVQRTLRIGGLDRVLIVEGR
jgi:anti-sigma B factor antagonist